NPRDARVEILRHVWRQAAARHHEFRMRMQRLDDVETFTPFFFADMRARQHEAIFGAGRLLEHGEVFERLLFEIDREIGDSLALDEAAKEMSARAAGRIDEFDAGAEANRDPRYIDATAAGKELRRRAAKLARRLDPFDGRRNIDRWIERQCNDIGHD